MLYRKNENKIRAFLTGKSNMALLVTGARQTGKTFSIRKVGKECFRNFVEINFINQPEMLDIFSGFKSAADILLKLSALFGNKLVKGKTLIFFDEVQECKEIVTAIKFLVDEGSYKYVLSGSLLGVELKDIKSVPVGYMSIMNMYPLDFEEFALAIGVGKDVISSLRDCFLQKTMVDDFIHSRMMELVKLYLIIGGMPAVVQKYLDTKKLNIVSDYQNNIINLYKKDISRYDPGHKLLLDEIFNLIPSELNAKNKRFVLKNLNENRHFIRHENSFLWLKDAGVALPVYNVEEPRLPLLLSKQRNLFKLFLNDVGLLACQYARDFQIRILSDDLNVNFGSVFENFVAQELNAHGFEHLFYFNSKRQGELDFVIDYKNSVLPLEVKSGKDYRRHNALSNVLSTDEYQIDNAIVFCTDNVSVDGKITYLPVYMTMFLEKDTSGVDMVYQFDLTGLR
ncbi:MAG: AAA family ATPase [Bacteroidales bacterium]|nr:AAA family ATPase [Bacteroidales bacterium]